MEDSYLQVETSELDNKPKQTSEVTEEEYHEAFLKYRVSEEEECVLLEDVTTIFQDLNRSEELALYQNVFDPEHFPNGLIYWKEFIESIQQINKGRHAKFVAGKLKLKRSATSILSQLEAALTGHNPDEPGQDDTFLNFNVQVGSNASDSRIRFQFGAGQEKEKLLQFFDFANLEKDNFYFLIEFKSPNPQALREYLENEITNALGIAEAFVPPQIFSPKEHLHIEYFTPDNDTVLVKVSTTHDMLGFAQEQFKAYEQHVDDVKFEVSLQTSLSFDKLTQNFDSFFWNFLSKDPDFGLDFHVYFDAKNKILKAAKALVNTCPISIGPLAYYGQHISTALELLQVQTKFDLKFNDPSSLFEPFQSVFGIQDYPIQHLVQQANIGENLRQTLKHALRTKINLKYSNFDQMTEEQQVEGYQKQVEFEQNIEQNVDSEVNFIRDNANADLSFYVVFPFSAVRFQVQLPGLGEFITKVISQKNAE